MTDSPTGGPIYKNGKRDYEAEIAALEAEGREMTVEDFTRELDEIVPMMRGPEYRKAQKRGVDLHLQFTAAKKAGRIPKADLVVLSRRLLEEVFEVDRDAEGPSRSLATKAKKGK